MKNAKEYGKNAYKKGMPCEPTLDRHFIHNSSMVDINPGAVEMLMNEWVEGWKESEKEMKGAK